jgi:hypothetical protein
LGYNLQPEKAIDPLLDWNKQNSERSKVVISDHKVANVG